MIGTGFTILPGHSSSRARVSDAGLSQVMSSFFTTIQSSTGHVFYLGHPQFEGFETIQTVGSGKKKTA
jgi:hypothetical protein